MKPWFCIINFVNYARLRSVDPTMGIKPHGNQNLVHPHREDLSEKNTPPNVLSA